ncbi:hypothetical protein QYF36_015921 [Acer negundo]|nr:hypothetical protein QYF36_015921 [Acer negundo]
MQDQHLFQIQVHGQISLVDLHAKPSKNGSDVLAIFERRPDDAEAREVHHNALLRLISMAMAVAAGTPMSFFPRKIARRGSFLIDAVPTRRGVSWRGGCGEKWRLFLDYCC